MKATDIKIEKKNMFRLLAIFLIASFVLAIVFKIVVDAKYTKTGMAGTGINANGFYFSSDCLKEEKNGDIPEYIMYGWDGKTTKSFAFKIRNYENPLLYNNEDQAVTYDITYEVPDEYKDKIDVALYRLVDGNYVEDHLNGKLEGGKNSYNFNDYKLSVTPKEGQQLTSNLSIKLIAKTVDSPYHRTLTTMVTLQYTEYKDFITSKGFVDIDTNDYALKYRICTANEVNMSEMENTNIQSATKKLHLYWNSNMLTLNRFDEKNWNEFDTKILGEDGITSETMNQYENVVIIDKVTGIAHLYFEALPFSEFNIDFYKVEGIKDSRWLDAVDSTKYIWETDEESLVNIKVVQ